MRMYNKGLTAFGLMQSIRFGRRSKILNHMVFLSRVSCVTAERKHVQLLRLLSKYRKGSVWLELIRYR